MARKPAPPDGDDDVGELVELRVRGVDLVDTPAIGKSWWVVKRFSGPAGGGNDVSELIEGIEAPTQDELAAAVRTVAGEVERGVTKRGTGASDEEAEALTALDLLVEKTALTDPEMITVQGAIDFLDTRKADFPRNVQVALATLESAVKGARQRGDMKPADAEEATEGPTGPGEEIMEPKPGKKPAAKRGVAKSAAEGEQPGSAAGDATNAKREEAGSGKGEAVNAKREEAGGGDGVAADRSRLMGGGITKAFEGEVTQFGRLTDALTAASMDVLKAAGEDVDRAGLATEVLTKFSESWMGLLKNAIDAYMPEVGEDGEITESSMRQLGAVTKFAGLVPTSKAEENAATQQTVKAAMEQITGGLGTLAALAGTGEAPEVPAEKGAGYRPYRASKSLDDGDDGDAPAENAAVVKTLSRIVEWAEAMQSELEDLKVSKRQIEASADEDDEDELEPQEEVLTVSKAMGLIDQRIATARRQRVHKSLGGSEDPEVEMVDTANVRKRLAQLPRRDRLDAMNQALIAGGVLS